MKKNEPLVSILLPVNNAETFLKDCLKSIKKQSHKNIEIIAIDDFSKDSSYKILKSFKKKDKRFRVFKNKKKYGVSVCLNRALKKAKGTFISFMDPDDITTMDKIKRQVRFLTSNPKIVAVGTQTVFINKKNKKVAKSKFPVEFDLIAKTLLSGASIQPETVMINKTLLPKDLLYFKPLAYPFIFSEVMVKLLSYGQVANLPWLLYYHRRLPDTSKEALIKKLPNLIKQLAKSITIDNYRPSLQNLLTNTKPVTSF